mgnify:FL=1
MNAFSRHTKMKMAFSVKLFLELLKTKLEIEIEPKQVEIIWDNLKNLPSPYPALTGIQKMMQEQDDFYAKPDVAPYLKDNNKGHFIGEELYSSLCNE